MVRNNASGVFVASLTTDVTRRLPPLDVELSEGKWLQVLEPGEAVSYVDVSVGSTGLFAVLIVSTTSGCSLALGRARVCQEHAGRPVRGRPRTLVRQDHLRLLAEDLDGPVGCGLAGTY